ncbi:MAG: glycerophosphodiester phosphodiesterase [Deltaproteobacteria bacterium]|nr:glycerophosphodiester phosphodiesterase [Deltaproteobacteria bacterium]
MVCSDVLLIAHRGESHDAPENTLASVKLAWERNADAVEIDVQQSKDGEIVVIHDSNTWRTGGVKREVRDQTLEELRILDMGKHKGDHWALERIPTFREVLETVPRGKRLFVEIKCGPEIIPELKTILEKALLFPDQVTFIGLELTTMSALKKHFPGHEVCWVCDMERDAEKDAWEPGVDEMVAKALETGIDGLDVFACEAVDKSFVRKVKASGMKLYVWTVNDPAEARRLCEAGVDGITTDRPHWLRTKLRPSEAS